MAGKAPAQSEKKTTKMTVPVGFFMLHPKSLIDCGRSQEQIQVLTRFEEHEFFKRTTKSHCKQD